MATTPRDILATAPEFAVLEPDLIGQAISDAVAWVNPDFWDTQVDQATRYFACHLLAVSHPDLVTAAPRSETIGPLTVEYDRSVTAASDDELETTVYGKRLKELIHQNPSSHVAVL